MKMIDYFFFYYYYYFNRPGALFAAGRTCQYYKLLYFEFRLNPD